MYASLRVQQRKNASVCCAMGRERNWVTSHAEKNRSGIWSCAEPRVDTLDVDPNLASLRHGEHRPPPECETLKRTPDSCTAGLPYAL